MALHVFLLRLFFVAFIGGILSILTAILIRGLRMFGIPYKRTAQCETDVANFVGAIQSKCPTCKILEQNCLDKLEPNQSEMLAAAPLDVPSALPDGIVTFKCPNPNVALAVCRESERQALMGPREGFVECYSPGQAPGLR